MAAPRAAQAQAGAASAAGAAARPAVYVFSTPGCPYCRRAKEALRERGVAYDEVDVSGDAALRAALGDAAGSKTIYVGGAHVGGSDDLAQAMTDGGFDALLAGGGADGLPERLRAAMESAEAAAGEAKAQAPPAAGPASAPPELLAAAAELAAAGLSAGGKPISGAALLEWLSRRPGGGGGGDLGAQLLERNLVTLVARSQPAPGDAASVLPGASYRLLADAPRRVEWGQPLNTHYWWGPAPARPAEVVAEDLRAQILGLYEAHLSKDGRAVSYRAMRDDPGFWRYADATAELQRVDLSPLSHDALSAFAINAYNALVVHALVTHGSERYRSTVGRAQFFQKARAARARAAACYVIGGSRYTLDDLENGVLRGNRPPASSLGMLLGCPALSSGPFVQGDPRAAKVVDPVDARIHFALVCGAKSCPPIRLYSAANLDEGLAAATEAFCADDVEIDVPSRTVTQSKIFKWYFPDFGPSKTERLRWLLPHLPAPKAAALTALLAGDPRAARVTVKHRDYDWGLNGDD
ncbi:MAG: glutaredoxin-like protein [Monoraphidium minutum]|nr:MAG: glutaredoxin-like protein [Monoraphidium minutum]